MTLTEFINRTREEYGLTEKTEDIVKKVTDYAMKHKTNNCTVLSDEDVLKVILGDKAQEKPAKAEKKPESREKPNTVKTKSYEMEPLF